MSCSVIHKNLHCRRRTLKVRAAAAERLQPQRGGGTPSRALPAAAQLRLRATAGFPLRRTWSLYSAEKLWNLGTASWWHLSCHEFIAHSMRPLERDMGNAAQQARSTLPKPPPPSCFLIIHSISTSMHLRTPLLGLLVLLLLDALPASQARSLLQSSRAGCNETAATWRYSVCAAATGGELLWALPCTAVLGARTGAQSQLLTCPCHLCHIHMLQRRVAAAPLSWSPLGRLPCRLALERLVQGQA